MPERAERGKMANDKYSGSYNAGPQLPSYMKKNTTAAKRTAAQGTAARSTASAARTSAAAKRTTAAHGTAHPHTVGNPKAAGRAGKGAAALPPVLPALHVHRLPPGRAVRSAMVGLHRHAKRSAAHRQPLPQQRSRQGHRGGRYQKQQEP